MRVDTTTLRLVAVRIVARRHGRQTLAWPPWWIHGVFSTEERSRWIVLPFWPPARLAQPGCPPARVVSEFRLEDVCAGIILFNFCGQSGAGGVRGKPPRTPRIFRLSRTEAPRAYGVRWTGLQRLGDGAEAVGRQDQTRGGSRSTVTSCGTERCRRS